MSYPLKPFLCKLQTISLILPPGKEMRQLYYGKKSNQDKDFSGLWLERLKVVYFGHEKVSDEKR